MLVKELIKESENLLSKVEIPNYQADIKSLIAFFMDTSITKLYALQNDSINFDLEQYWVVLNDYKNGKPLQHITNSQYFYGNDFYVDHNVLIPRYETEELVDNITILIDEYDWNNKNLTIIDVGTGSGAIAISLGLQYPNSQIIASDISPEALIVAQKNITKLKTDNVKLLKGDMLEPFINAKIKADILICNPPYIPKQQEISRRVKEYEPHVALFGDNDGLYFYRKIFSKWQDVAKNKAILCFEHGFDQKKDLEKLVKKFFPNQKYQFIKDVNKKWRMLFIFIL